MKPTDELKHGETSEATSLTGCHPILVGQDLSRPCLWWRPYDCCLNKSCPSFSNPLQARISRFHYAKFG